MWLSKTPRLTSATWKLVPTVNVRVTVVAQLVESTIFPVVVFVYWVTVCATADAGRPHAIISSTTMALTARNKVAFQTGSDPIFIFAPVPTSNGTAKA